MSPSVYAGAYADILAGLWRFRGCVLASPLLPAALAVVLYYLFWFFGGSSQRVRHLVPVYPVALMLAAVAAARWAGFSTAARPLAAAAALTIGLQMAAHGASSYNYARYVFGGESRDDFLLRNLAGYDSVRMINRRLGPDDKVLITNRQMSYYINVPYFFANITFQAQLDILPQANDAGLYYRQLRALGISHILTTAFPADGGAGEGSRGSRQWRALLALGCAREIDRADYRAVYSRSLGIVTGGGLKQALLSLGGPDCLL